MPREDERAWNCRGRKLLKTKKAKIWLERMSHHVQNKITTIFNFWFRSIEFVVCFSYPVSVTIRMTCSFHSSPGCCETFILVPSQCALKSALEFPAREVWRISTGYREVLIKTPHQGSVNCSRRPSHLRVPTPIPFICCSSQSSDHSASRTLQKRFFINDAL